MSKPSPVVRPQDLRASPLYSKDKELNGSTEMDDPEKTMSTVAKLIDQLHSSVSSPAERELTTARLLGIAKSRKEARALIGSHGQAMPLFVSILRSGTHIAKVNAAQTLTVLCRDEDLRVKVLLGGCIPPLLSLLKSDYSTEAQKAAAEALCEVSSGGPLDDHVGMKIFVTEGVVPALWEQLNPKNKQDKVVEGFITGALRNLCGDKDGYWRSTLDDGGVDMIVALLSSDNSLARSNAASLLARLILAFPDSIPKVIDSGAVKALLRLLGEEKNVSVRVSAAEALEALSLKSTNARKAIIDALGMPVLIESVVAPSKEGMRDEGGLALQQHSTQALANICGGMPELILYLGELSQLPRLSAPVADIIGALAYTLMIFKQNGNDIPFQSTKIESILIMLLKPRDNKLVQERILEALASLYSYTHPLVVVNQSEVKRVLIGLITMSTADTQEYLISSLIRMCTEGLGVWEALDKREGIQILISSLGLSSEQHQEYAVEMLLILTEQVDDSMWAITAAGGIPPLVQIIEVGSQKAKVDAARILSNLGCHSEDIRDCVESSGAISALLWLLKNGEGNGPEAAASSLVKLIKCADSATINQLLALLFGDSPSSKAHVIKVLGYVLSTASHSDLVNRGATANKGLRSLVQVLNSSNAKTQEYAASVLADLFSNRQDICDSLAMDEVVNPCMKLLTSNTHGIVTQSARALGALSRSSKTKSPSKMPYIAEGDVQPLIKLAKTSSIDSAETAMAALANLLSDPQIASEALAEDVVSAIVKVLGEGSLQGKQSASRALHQLLKHIPVGDVLTSSAQCRLVVLTIADSLTAMQMDGIDDVDALELLSLLCRTKYGRRNSNYSPCIALAENPSSLEPLIRCLCEGTPQMQDKAVEILSRLSSDYPVLLGDLLISCARSLGALAGRVMKSKSLEVRVGSTTLLICAAKEHKTQGMNALETSGLMELLIYALVDMIKQNSNCHTLEIDVRTPRGFRDRSAFRDKEFYDVPDPATVLGSTVALWLLAIVSSSVPKYKVIIMEAGGVEVLSEKLARRVNNGQAEFDDNEGTWISAVLAAILFQDADVVSSPTALHFVTTLASLLKSDEMIDRFFSAQAMASLVSHGNRGINLSIANSGAFSGLISLLGHIESDMPNLVALSEEFSLVKNPDQLVLERLFSIEDVREGSVARKTIPLLVDLLRPMPDRPGAPPFAVRLLTQIADGNDTNKLLMAEAGALDALTRYLSLSPQDLVETTISELLRILFSNKELLRYEAAISCLEQLIAVLHLGSRSARLSAARTVDELFDADHIRESEISVQAIQPLAEMLDIATSECEQRAALSALVKLTSGSNSNASILGELELNPLHSLCKTLSSNGSLELKRYAAELCAVLFNNSKIREMPAASECIEPLIMLMQAGEESAVCAFEKLLDDDQKKEITLAHDFVSMLVNLISGSNHRLAEASICTLIKLGKDRTPRKLDMVKAGIIDKCLEILPNAPSSLCAMIAELFRILTNSSAVSKSSAAAKIVEPLFMVLLQTDIGLWGQHSALQALVNILEKPQSLSTLKLTPNQVIEPLITFLESPSQAIQQLGTELLSHLLEQEHFKQDITTQSAVIPLVQLSGIGIPSLQQTAVKALESISLSWPKAVADAGGIFELSKVIIQDDPLPPEALWESSALVLSNILRSDTDYYMSVPIITLVKMLRSHVESTITIALNALTVQEKTDPSSAELMGDAGAIDALLDLMRSHRCEEESGRLLEALFNHMRVREMKASKYAIAPLAQYLLDPQTRLQSGKLLAALSLGDLSQHEGLARSSSSVSACRALVNLLEDQPSEEMKVVAICALQNFVMHSRTNRRAVAEAGGVLVVQELVLSEDQEVAAQAALLTRFLFSNHTLQEYVSNELIRSLTAALERELWSTAMVNEEVLKTLHMIFANFPKLHISEAATLCIPHLITALKSGSEVAQDSVLTTLCLLKQSWSAMPLEVSRSQSIAASESIPLLQMLIKTCPPSFHDRIESLLNCLPGCLTVAVKRANNLKHVMGGTNPFCRLSIGNGPSRSTKVVSHNTSPEWKEAFTWAFDVPPKGQKLHIVCRSRSTFGKPTLGRVTIQIDKVVSEGVYSGVFGLGEEGNKDGSSRTLEMEITWSSRMPNE